MRRSCLILIALFLVCFSLVAWLQPRQAARTSRRDESGNILALLLGDGRKMFANHFFVKADVYFHSGYYPSIFDQSRQEEENDSDVSHPEESGGKVLEKGFMGEPQDWIDRFSRHFRPISHTHLSGETVGEILPWMKLSVEMDPHRIQTYTVTAYWLRSKLKKSDEAEKLLRDGLKANPNSPDLLCALGTIYLVDRKDFPHARNLFLAALRRWHEVEEPKPEKTATGEGERNDFLLGEILGKLSEEEDSAGRLGKAIEYLELLKQKSPQPQMIQKRIDVLSAKMFNGIINTNAPFVH